MSSLLVSMLLIVGGCGTSDALPIPVSDASLDLPPDASQDLDAGDTPGIDSGRSLPNDPVSLPNGVVPVDARIAFCTEVAKCLPKVVYQDCLVDATSSAVGDFARPGCDATDLLIAAIGCQRSVDVCASRVCDAAIEAWSIASKSKFVLGSKCYRRDGFGIGDAYSPKDGDAECESGVRAAGGWCTGACVSDAACEGKYPGGKNAFGMKNVCGPDSLIGGGGCYPQCASTKQCVDWYGVTYSGFRNITCRKVSELAVPVCLMGTNGVELP